MTTIYIILGALISVTIGLLLLGRWVCNIINETCNIDTEFNFEEDESYLS